VGPSIFDVLITGGGSDRISASLGTLGGGVGGVVVLIVEKVKWH